MTLTKRDEIEIDHMCKFLIASENGWKWISWIKNDNIDQIKKHGVVDVRPTTYTSKITYLPTK
jgi:hypothetical protein